MRVISVNVNGIRSAAKKGFFDWLKTQNADVICLQELKAHECDIQDALYCPDGYFAYFHCAEKKGYSGVGIYTKHKPIDVTMGLDWDVANNEGRYVAVDLGHCVVASIYLPSGTSGEERQAIKFDFLARYEKHLLRQLASKKEFIICGDINIAHQAIDLKNWRGNQKNSGFLPEERAWMDKILTEYGIVDGFRAVNNEADQYTWWSNRGRAWENNVGWRIDYQLVSPGLKNAIKSAHIYKEQRFSDHAPLILDYDMI